MSDNEHPPETLEAPGAVYYAYLLSQQWLACCFDDSRKNCSFLSIFTGLKARNK